MKKPEIEVPHEHRIEHSVVAVSDSSSELFAEKLQKALNNHLSEGEYSLMQTLQRNDNKDLILVFARRVCLPPTEPEEEKGVHH